MMVAYKRGGMNAGMGADPRVNSTTIFMPGTGPGTGLLATPGDVETAMGGPASYVAPNLVPVPACSQDTRPGGAAFSSECIAQVLAAQHTNQAAADSANRDVFVANCNRDYAANAAQYAALGMAVPPNDCAYRGYGLTAPGTTGGSVAYIAGTPQAIIDWRATNPGGGSPGPAAPTGNVVPAPAAAPGSSPAAGSGASPAGSPAGYIDAATGFFSNGVDVAGFNLPIWGLAAAGVAALLLFKGGR